MKKKIDINTPKVMNVLLYDDANIIYYDGIVSYFSQEANSCSGELLDGSRYNFITSYDITMTIPDLEQKEVITLDETLMKRIAKYNKEKECLQLDKLIEEKKKIINELDNELQDKSERWNKVKAYIANIYDLDLNEEEDDNYDYDD